MKENILAAIIENETIIIHRHIRPDPDAYGSQCGLAEILKTSFPEKKIYTVGENEPTLQFLYQMDDIEDAIYHEALVIVCDTANQERVCDQRYQSGKMLIKIDHHPNVDPYGDLRWIDTNASSVSEMIYEFYLFGKDKGLKLSNKGAELIFAGIVGDTGRFLFPSTTEKSFVYASELIGYDFSFPKIYQEMYKIKQNVVHLSGYIFQHFKMTSSGAASMIVTKELLEQFNVTPTEASQLVGSLGNIEGMKAWVFFVEEENQIRARLRSKGPIINGIAQKYNGGGHPLAAGASIYSWEEAEQVFQELDLVCQE